MIGLDDTVTLKRMKNSPDMSRGKVIKINYNHPFKVIYGNTPEIKSIQVQFYTEKHTWDTETRKWIAGTFIRTIHNLKHVKVIV